MKALLRRMAWQSGALRLERRIRNHNCLTVVMFHRVLPAGSPEMSSATSEFTLTCDEFEACLRFFADHYAIVRLEDVEEARNRHRALPPNSLLITFDDGWLDNVTFAEPLLRSYRLSATIFVNLEALRQPGIRWWQDQLDELASQGSEMLRRATGRGNLVEAQEIMLRIPLEDRESTLAPNVARCTMSRQMLNERAVSDLDRSIWSLGSHGATHMAMTSAPNLDFEVCGSADALTNLWGSKVVSLALPHGQFDDRVLREASSRYDLVFTSQPYLNRLGSGGAPRSESVLGRIHVSASVLRLTGDALAPHSLATFFWRRPAH